MKKHILRLAAVSVLALSPSFAATMVGVELQLLIDVSASISTAQYALQRDGYAAAFLDPIVIENIEALAEDGGGGIAVQVVQWAGEKQQTVSIDWTQLQTEADSKAFSAELSKMKRAFVGGLTAVQAALLFGSTQFANDFDGKRLITDISGDGFCNDPLKGGCGVGGKDAMIAEGVLVNGLVIGGEKAVEDYYESDVVTKGGVVYKAAAYADFEEAIIAKIRAETADVPEPSTWAMIVTGLAGLMVSVRRRRA
jgi:hypothetical protein